MRDEHTDEVKWHDETEERAFVERMVQIRDRGAYFMERHPRWGGDEYSTFGFVNRFDGEGRSLRGMGL